jgi:hypothetical protein
MQPAGKASCDVPCPKGRNSRKLWGFYASPSSQTEPSVPARESVTGAPHVDEPPVRCPLSIWRDGAVQAPNRRASAHCFPSSAAEFEHRAWPPLSPSLFEEV